MATLKLPNLTWLTNDPIAHSPWWLIILSKFPSDIPKFNGNLGEDLSMHVMMYNLWCSSKSLDGDSIRLRLFQRMLIHTATKWYIELPKVSFHDFNTLSTTFLTHFSFHIRYESGTELLTNFKQSHSTHISDHIHEWRHCRQLVKTYVPV